MNEDAVDEDAVDTSAFTFEDWQREAFRHQARVAYLERVVAYEARIIEAQTLDLKSLAKYRRLVLEESVEAMRNVVVTGTDDRYSRESAYRELDALRLRRAHP